MDSSEKPPSRQQARNAARRSNKPPGEPKRDAEPTLSRTELWAARQRKNLAARQFQAATVEITLPSLLTIEARRMTLASMFELDQIPNALLPTIREWFQAFQRFDDPDERAAAIGAHVVDHHDDYLAVARFVWLACVVDPVFVETDRDGRPVVVLADHPDLPEVAELDLIYFFEWAQGVDQTAADWFRSRSTPDLEPAQTGDEIRDDAGDAPGDRGDGGSVAGVPVE